MKEDGVAVKEDDVPEVLPHAHLYWDAYSILTRARVWTEGRPRSVPLSEIAAYCQLRALGPDHIETLLRVMTALEDVYFKWYEQQSQKGNRGKGVAGAKPRRKPKP